MGQICRVLRIVAVVTVASAGMVGAAQAQSLAGSFTVSASKTPAPTLTETGTLPNGVTLDASTGALAGTLTHNGVFLVSLDASKAVSTAVQSTPYSAPLSGVASVASDGGGYCAVLTSGGVDCWGYGAEGELGDGKFYRSGNDGCATPVLVVGFGGAGSLSGVAGVVSDGGGYCGLLTSGGVDCWGFGYEGGLGDGTFYTSATPVQVVGVGGAGLSRGWRAL